MRGFGFYLRFYLVLQAYPLVASRKEDSHCMLMHVCMQLTMQFHALDFCVSIHVKLVIVYHSFLTRISHHF